MNGLLWFLKLIRQYFLKKFPFSSYYRSLKCRVNFNAVSEKVCESATILTVSIFLKAEIRTFSFFFFKKTPLSINKVKVLKGSIKRNRMWKIERNKRRRKREKKKFLEASVRAPGGLGGGTARLHRSQRRPRPTHTEPSQL